MAKKSISLKQSGASVAQSSLVVAAKTEAQRQFPISPRPLSFDGGSLGEGGFGHWYPRRLTDAELESALTEDDGTRIRGAELTAYCAGGLTGQLAAAEYAEHLRKQKANYYDQEYSDDLSDILFDMLGVTRESIGERRYFEAVNFIACLFPYLAFGCRNVTEADKRENAKR